MTALEHPRPDLLAAGLRGRLRLAEPMSRHTSWRVGGPAERCFEPADIDDLAAYLRRLPPGEPVLWVGLGSNLLVRDGGLRGSVILTGGVLDGIERLDRTTVRFGAGVACAKAARHCASAGLVGAEFLVGIPGTMGGALAMNAGAFGGETWSLVAGVETMDRAGRLRLREPGEFRVGYRSVEGPAGEWFVAARLRLSAGDAAAATARIRELLNRRSETQPTGVASCGSVFRNPAGDYAGRLIESCGLKGHCIGRACVSEKHANFILNRGGATAADIEALIGHIQDTVERERGVRLEPEVRIVGERAGEGRRGDD
jgi:UDP-N-acetylmuramate dehydrogenase